MTKPVQSNEDIRIRMDKVCDYIPGVSTITNMVDLVGKAVLSRTASDSTVYTNHYYTHIKTKSILRCIVLCVPVLGNILVGLFKGFFGANYQVDAHGVDLEDFENDLKNLSCIEAVAAERATNTDQENLKALKSSVEGILQPMFEKKKLTDIEILMCHAVNEVLYQKLGEKMDLKSRLTPKSAHQLTQKFLSDKLELPRAVTVLCSELDLTNIENWKSHGVSETREAMLNFGTILVMFKNAPKS